mmetsp:Transcript_68408/g.103150  ORF Transcript_68408/g.103150 Transcript_68408/m.103150 type:complete len:322 (+) Transcript_68408:49-1014(+)
MNCDQYEESLQALVRQESAPYRTIDYLADEHLEVAASSAPAIVGNSNFASSPCGKKKRRLTSSLSDDTRTSDGLCDSASATASSVGSRTLKYWREMMCTWAYRVIDHFDLRRELVGIAMSYLDRYMSTLSNPRAVDKKQYQLVSMTCLYLAIKLYEFKHIGIPGSCSTMDTIRQLSQGNYTLQQIEEMEIDIMQRLRWHLHPPTPQAFIDLFVNSESSEPGDLGNFLVELAAMDYFFVSYKPSEIAAAAVLNATDQLYGGFPSATVSMIVQRLQPFAGPRVQECRTRLDLAYRQLGDTDDSQWQVAPGGTRSPVTVMTTSF